MNIRNPFNWNLRFGSIPSEFKEAMTYEEQIIWLYSQIKQLKEGSANYNYDLLENKPSIDGVILQGNVTKTQLGIEQNYNILANKPAINSIPLVGNLSLNDLGIQGKLIPGSGIRISGNTISTTGGGGGGTSDYEELENLPSINGHELIGNQTANMLGLQDTLEINYLPNAIESKYYDMTNVQVGDTLTFPFQLSDDNLTECLIIKKEIGMDFILHGVFEFLLTNPNLEVTGKYSSNLQENTARINNILDGGFIIINLSRNSGNPTLYQIMNGNYIQSLFNKLKPKELNINVVLFENGKQSLETGYYYFGESKGLYYHQELPDNIIYGSNDGIFYFDNFSQIFYLDNKIYYYDTASNDWLIEEHSNITNEIVNSRNKIPTSQAVYNALQNIQPTNLFYTKLTEEYFCNSDGSVTNSNGDVLSSGYYFNTYGIHYNNTYDLNFANTIFYYNSQLGYIIKCLDEGYTTLKYYLYYRDTSQSWELHETETNSAIPASGDNTKIPTNNAVRNYVNGKISRFASYQISTDTNLTTTNDWRSQIVPIEPINNNIQDLISFNDSTHTFTALKNCKLKVELNSGLNYTTGTTGNPYFAVLRIKKTSGGVTSYVSSSILLFGDTANNNSLINELQLNTGDTFSYEINFGTAGTYRLLGGRTYVIFTEMI